MRNKEIQVFQFGRPVGRRFSIPDARYQGLSCLSRAKSNVSPAQQDGPMLTMGRSRLWATEQGLQHRKGNRFTEEGF